MAVFRVLLLLLFSLSTVSLANAQNPTVRNSAQSHDKRYARQKDLRYQLFPPSPDTQCIRFRLHMRSPLSLYRLISLCYTSKGGFGGGKLREEGARSFSVPRASDSAAPPASLPNRPFLTTLLSQLAARRSLPKAPMWRFHIAYHSCCTLRLAVLSVLKHHCSAFPKLDNVDCSGFFSSAEGL